MKESQSEMAYALDLKRRFALKLAAGQDRREARDNLCQEDDLSYMELAVYFTIPSGNGYTEGLLAKVRADAEKERAKEIEDRSYREWSDPMPIVEALEYTRLSKPKFKEYFKAGIFKREKSNFGRRYLYERKELDALIEYLKKHEKWYFKKVSNKK